MTRIRNSIIVALVPLALCVQWYIQRPKVLRGDVPRFYDNAPCFHPMGANLRTCAIYHDAEGRLIMEFELPVLNAWFQFIGDGLVETVFDRHDTESWKRAVAWRFDATDSVPDPGKGISTSPGYVAVRITGTLKPPSGIEDVVYDTP